jgi:hypothetical protein
MKYLIVILAIFSLVNCSQVEKRSVSSDSAVFGQKTMVLDTGFIKSIRLDDIIVCNTTITDLRKKGFNPEIKDNNSIDSLIKSSGWDIGTYFSEDSKKIIIGTYENSELISSVFLSGHFKGYLRDFYINDFSKLTVGEITSSFKDLEWTITGVSDYWKYGNDTIVFYIKVDKGIPRFPLDENYYQDKHPVLAMVQYYCYKIYGNNYLAGDTVVQKPMYAPLSDSHLNYFLLRRKPGLSTTLKEIISTGKKTVLEEIKIGKWVDYNPDHTIKNIRLYNNGQIIKTEK